jgi:hypothetical protein
MATAAKNVLIWLFIILGFVLLLHVYVFYRASTLCSPEDTARFGEEKGNFMEANGDATILRCVTRISCRGEKAELRLAVICEVGAIGAQIRVARGPNFFPGYLPGTADADSWAHGFLVAGLSGVRCREGSQASLAFDGGQGPPPVAGPANGDREVKENPAERVLNQISAHRIF